MLKFFKFLVIPVIWFGCTPQLSYELVDFGLSPKLPSKKEVKAPNCRDVEAYMPDTSNLLHTPIRNVKVNIHLMNSKTGTHFFSEEEGVKWAKNVIRVSNEMLWKNVKAKLPEGNDISVLPIRIRFRITPRPGVKDDDGIYFHYDDDICFSIKKGKHSNLYKKDMYKRYGVMKDTVLNIFFSPQHPDSVASKTYNSSNGGIALGKFVKMALPFGSEKDLKPWKVAHLLNHEIGHIFGLVHAWGYEDGCADTPLHSIKVRSNNVMDYNSNQSSWTPCQIAKVHQRMSDQRTSVRNFIRRDWCKLDTQRVIIIRDTVNWLGAKDLKNNIIIEEGGYLNIGCRVSLPRNATVNVRVGGTLELSENAHLHNDCGDTWKGVIVEKIKKLKGTILIAEGAVVENLASDHSESGGS